MNIIRHTLLVAMAIGLTASCAHVPRIQRDDPETTTRRTQYLREHPNGAHNAQIVRGEVTRGMSAMEVVASWGLPEHREVEKKSNKERWTYTSRDVYSSDYVSYELVLVDLVLRQWSVGRGTAGEGVRAVDWTPDALGHPAFDVRDGARRK